MHSKHSFGQVKSGKARSRTYDAEQEAWVKGGIPCHVLIVVVSDADVLQRLSQKLRSELK